MNNNKKPKILVLGAFHMNGLLDMHNTNINDVLSSRRQAEIKELINLLKEYKPTKIAVEHVIKDNDNINKDYNAYLDGAFDLKSCERHQIGFRLAKELNHTSVYPIDWMERGVAIKGCSEVYEWAQKNRPDLYDEILAKDYTPLDMNSSILQMYQTINSPEDARDKRILYTNMARIKSPQEYVGIDWLLWWYQRNLIIFSNLSSIVDSENDRILLLIGASHKYIIEGFVRDSEYFELVDANDFLYK